MITKIVAAIANYRSIHGDHQSRKTGRLSAANQVFGDVTVFENIKLKPHKVLKRVVLNHMWFSDVADIISSIATVEDVERIMHVLSNAAAERNLKVAFLSLRIVDIHLHLNSGQCNQTLYRLDYNFFKPILIVVIKESSV